MDERPHLTWSDAALPALLLALGAVELASLRSDGWVAAVGIEALAAALLVPRRRYAAAVAPAAVLALTWIPLTGSAMDEAATPILFIIVGVFSLGRWTRLRTGVPLLVLTLLLVLAVTASLDPRTEDWTDVMFIVSLGVPPFVFGRIVLRLDEQRVQLAAQQELIATQAVRAERDRIARELHDVIAHSISAMVVQTAAAQDLLRSQPDRAAALLESVAATGREALAETGRLLHLVRDEDGELGLAPAPCVADLPDLVESFRERGLDVRAELDLPSSPLPGAVDVSTYRLVQEALTNALRHGRGQASLRVTCSPDCLRVSCTNASGTPSRDGSGLGLRGMAERVDLLGGTITTGHRPDGDFGLEIAIPLDAAVVR